MREEGEPTKGVGMELTKRQVYLKLQGKIELGTVSNLVELECMTALCDLRIAMKVFLTWEVKGSNSDIQRLLDGDIRAYRWLEIPVARLSGEGYVVHYARCTGLNMFRGQKRSDWVWVRRHRASDVA